MKFQENVPLKNYTTFKIGGPAKYFFVAKTKNSLIKAIQAATKENLPFFILGGGSNLLVSDKGFNGLVIKMQNTDYKIAKTILAAGAGVSLAKLVSLAAEAGLSGMEWASGIPGATLGGAVRGNAGAFDSEIKDIVDKVEALDTSDLKFRIFQNKDCKFGYRKSIFSAQGGSASGGKKNSNLIILSCQLKLKKGSKEEIKKKTREILNYRKSHHPFNPSAGSVFKNLKNIRAKDLIKKAGLKGKQIGRAQISPVHANFIVNLGGASSQDVLKLIDLIKKQVKNKFNVKLEEEIRLLK